MKRILSVALLTGCTVFLLSTVAVGQQKTPPPPPPPKAPKTEKHIKMVKVDDKGNKVELDTVLTSDAPFVWNGDTIGGGKEMKWISKGDFMMDSMHQNNEMNFEYKIEDDGEGNVMILKSGKGGNHMMMAPMPPGAPMPPHVMMLRSHSNRNVIDLSDPGIISYDKKIGGTFHLALGSGFGEAGGINESVIHWDLISDAAKETEMHVDGELFYKDGKFLV